MTGTELTNAYVFLMFADTEPVPRLQMHTFFLCLRIPNRYRAGTELTNAYVFLMFADTEPVPNRYRVGTEPVPRSQMHTFF